MSLIRLFLQLLHSAQLRLLVVVLGCFLPLTSAHAITLFVEGFGDDGNTCRKFTTPCKTIGGALTKLVGRDTIVVGDGVYQESVDIPFSGVKLVSRRGAQATTIDSSDIPNSSAVVIANSGVRVGQRNRGFTLLGGANAAGIRVLGDSAVVEGNVAVAGDNGDPTDAGDAIVVSFNRAAIRFNTTDGHISLKPLNEFSVAIANERVTDNVLLNGHISIQSSTPISRNLVQNNRMLNGSLFAGGVREYSNTGVLTRYNSNDRFIGNQMTSSSVITDGRFIFERNTVRGLFTSDSNNSVIRRNSMPGPGFIIYGLLVAGDTSELTIQSNVINGFGVGILVGSDSTMRAIKSNNIWGSTICAYTFNEVPSIRPVVATGNFYGAPGLPDLSCSGSGEEALAAGQLILRPRATPNPY